MSQSEIGKRNGLKSLFKESFIHEQKSPFAIRVLKKIDIFAFIPVPKDDSVSTKQSLIGTSVFFILFLAYIIIDFYQFIALNPPNAQNFYTKLDNQSYKLPRFAATFMNGPLLNISSKWDGYLNFTLSEEQKDKGSQKMSPVNFDIYEHEKGNQQNPSISWIDQETKSFYKILKTSSQPLYAKGLLYSTSNAKYGKIRIQMCNQTLYPAFCKPVSQIQSLVAGGRVFLFIQNVLDTTDFAAADNQNSNKFLIFNSFLEPYLYKRLTFNFQVVKTVVEPDYFFRFTKQTQTRLQIQSYIEQNSNVSLNAYTRKLVPLDMLGIQLQLSPQILNVHVTYRTLIDHISIWGAFWGVLFAVFAIIFLTYNRNKFYKKNPEWDKFRNNNIVIDQEGSKDT